MEDPINSKLNGEAACRTASELLKEFVAHNPKATEVLSTQAGAKNFATNLASVYFILADALQAGKP